MRANFEAEVAKAKADFDKKRARDATETVDRPTKLKPKQRTEPGASSRLPGTKANRTEELRVKRLEEKAKLYDAIKSGQLQVGDDEIGGLLRRDNLGHSSEGYADGGGDGGDDSEEDAGDDPGNDPGDPGKNDGMTEVEDEFGRTRLVRAEAVSAGTDAVRPNNLIHGNVIQHEAIQTAAFSRASGGDSVKVATEQVKKRLQELDRDTHYDADFEVRTQGAGSYQLSQDEAKRRQQMESLAQIGDEIRQAVGSQLMGAAQERLKEVARKRAARDLTRLKQIEILQRSHHKVTR